MDKNARAHTKAVVIEWPAMVPDMNPIEHLLDELKTYLRKRSCPRDSCTAAKCNPRKMGKHSPRRGRDSHMIDEKSNGSSPKSQRRE